MDTEPSSFCGHNIMKFKACILFSIAAISLWSLFPLEADQFSNNVVWMTDKVELKEWAWSLIIMLFYYRYIKYFSPYMSLTTLWIQNSLLFFFWLVLLCLADKKENISIAKLSFVKSMYFSVTAFLPQVVHVYLFLKCYGSPSHNEGLCCL